MFVDIEVGNKLKENKFRPKINWEQISHLKLFLFRRVDRRRPLVDKFRMGGMEDEEGSSAEAPSFELLFCSNPSPSFAKISDEESPSVCEVLECLGVKRLSWTSSEIEGEFSAVASEVEGGLSLLKSMLHLFAFSKFS